ncbi:MAG TPA: hypothetical protein VM198_03780 [Longimicrobiales bacterium]|nr:hypothetical protein [Longimicrobiales bacterium]
MRSLAVASFMAGPAMAVLYETGLVRLGPRATLWPVGVVAGAAGVGVIVGVLLGRRVSGLVGVIVSGANALVLAYYGFFLAFFGLGGSR